MTADFLISIIVQHLDTNHKDTANGKTAGTVHYVYAGKNCECQKSKSSGGFKHYTSSSYFPLLLLLKNISRGCFELDEEQGEEILIRTEACHEQNYKQYEHSENKSYMLIWMDMQICLSH